MSTDTVVWEGRFGETDLKIEIPSSGRIHAEWTTDTGPRNKVVDTIEQLEKGVLFQLMVGQEVDEQTRDEITDAVALTLANRLPTPTSERYRQNNNKGKKKRRGGPHKGGRRRGGGGGSRRRRR